MRIQFDEPILSDCTRPSSTSDWTTSLTDCETAKVSKSEYKQMGLVPMPFVLGAIFSSSLSYFHE